MKCDLEERAIKYRREFHKYAEVAWTEFRTSSRIAGVLEVLGYEVYVGKENIDPDFVMGRNEENLEVHIQRALDQGAEERWMKRMNGYTGVVAVLDTKKQGPVIAFRFDIDANELEESQEEEHRPFREGFISKNKGAMHACGHDGHIAIGLVFAEELSKQKEQLSGKIKLIFQPAEEGVRGARAMVEKGVLEDVKYLFSGHIGFGVPDNKVAVQTAGFLCTTKLDVTYIGKSSHAGIAPNEGNNALLAAASAVLNLHAIPPHKEGITRIHVGTLQAGVGRNTVAPNAFMQIETRGEEYVLNEYMYEKAIRIIEHTAKMYDLSFKIEKVGEAINGVCDEELISIAKTAIKNVDTLEAVENEFSFGASEDVTWMMKAVQNHGGKSSYFVFGSKITAQHHNEKFDFNEKVMGNAVEIYEGIAKLLMGS